MVDGNSVNNALKRGFYQQIRFLLKFGCPVNCRDAAGRTPLMNCVFVQESSWGVGLARTLLEHGAQLWLRDSAGLSATHHAVQQERIELLKLFLRSADFNLLAGDEQGDTILHYSVHGNRPEVTRLVTETLLKYGLSLNRRNRRGETALWQAWRLGHAQCAQVLEDSGKCADDIADVTEQRTAAQLRAEHRHRDSVTSHSRLSTPARGGRITPALSRPVTHSRTIRHTGRGDVTRSQPELLFHMAAAHCFDTESGGRRRHSGESSQDHKPQFSVNWRSELKKLYADFDYQFTRSYCRSAKFVRRGSAAPRSVSALGSDLESEPVDLATVLRGRAGRRGSVMSTDTDMSLRSKGKGKRRESNSSALGLLQTARKLKATSPAPGVTSHGAVTSHAEEGEGRRKKEEVKKLAKTVTETAADDALSAIKE